MSSIVSAIVGSPTRQYYDDGIVKEIPLIDLTHDILYNPHQHAKRPDPLDRQPAHRMLLSKPMKGTLLDSQQQYRETLANFAASQHEDMDLDDTWRRSVKSPQSIEKEMVRLERQKTLALEAADTLKALEKEAKRQASRRSIAPLTLPSRVALGAAVGVLRGLAGSNQVMLTQLGEDKREAERQKAQREGGIKTKKTFKKHKGSILVHKDKLRNFNKCRSRTCHKNKIRRTKKNTKRIRGTKRRTR